MGSSLMVVMVVMVTLAAIIMVKFARSFLIAV